MATSLFTNVPGYFTFGYRFYPVCWHGPLPVASSIPEISNALLNAHTMGLRATWRHHHIFCFLGFSSILGPARSGGGRTCGWVLGLCCLLRCRICEICCMFCEGVRNVLVYTDSSFRFFIIAVNVLRNNITFTTLVIFMPVGPVESLSCT